MHAHSFAIEARAMNLFGVFGDVARLAAPSAASPPR